MMAPACMKAGVAKTLENMARESRSTRPGGRRPPRTYYTSLCTHTLRMKLMRVAQTCNALLRQDDQIATVPPKRCANLWGTPLSTREPMTAANLGGEVQLIVTCQNPANLRMGTPSALPPIAAPILKSKIPGVPCQKIFPMAPLHPSNLAAWQKLG
jgi:hypothetical protein